MQCLHCGMTWYPAAYFMCGMLRSGYMEGLRLLRIERGVRLGRVD